jgi:hypothetical protein
VVVALLKRPFGFFYWPFGIEIHDQLTARGEDESVQFEEAMNIEMMYMEQCRSMLERPCMRGSYGSHISNNTTQCVRTSMIFHHIHICKIRLLHPFRAVAGFYHTICGFATCQATIPRAPQSTHLLDLSVFAAALNQQQSVQSISTFVLQSADTEVRDWGAGMLPSILETSYNGR